MEQTLEQLIEICGNNLYLDINIEIGTELVSEARKIVKGPSSDAKVYFGRGKGPLEAFQNLYKELVDKNLV
jgi:hypothetical protein